MKTEFPKRKLTKPMLTMLSEKIYLLGNIHTLPERKSKNLPKKNLMKMFQGHVSCYIYWWDPNNILYLIY